jgi:hypothetical protein
MVTIFTAVFDLKRVETKISPEISIRQPPVTSIRQMSPLCQTLCFNPHHNFSARTSSARLVRPSRVTADGDEERCSGGWGGHAG